MSLLQRVFALFIVLLTGAIQAEPLAAQETRIGIERGAVPAGPTLQDVHGGEVDLSDHFGDGPVLLEFWATSP